MNTFPKKSIEDWIALAEKDLKGKKVEDLKFISKETSSSWFEGNPKPILRGEVKESDVFF